MARAKRLILRPLAPKTVRKVTERIEGAWVYQRWSDGTCQWCLGEKGKRGCLYVERVIARKSRRPKWCVVNRCTDKPTAFPGINEYNTKLYPPIVAGPFEDLAGAKAALMILLTINGG
jgi:hypothetical protein